jgi:hypothetical protein
MKNSYFGTKDSNILLVLMKWGVDVLPVLSSQVQ